MNRLIEDWQTSQILIELDKSPLTFLGLYEAVVFLEALEIGISLISTG